MCALEISLVIQLVVAIPLCGILLLLIGVFSCETIAWEVFGDLNLFLQFNVIVPVEPLSQLLLKLGDFSSTELG